MRTFDSYSADSARVGPLDIARWEQYGLQATMPFGAMWYTVPAGQSSLRDCHPELELSIVIEGIAVVESNSRTVEVPRGAAILFDSEEAHVVHNRNQDGPLTIFSAYWMPLSPTGSGPESSELESGAPESGELESGERESSTSGQEPANV